MAAFCSPTLERNRQSAATSAVRPANSLAIIGGACLALVARMRAHRSWGGLAVLCFALAGASVARASTDGLSIETVESGPWASSIAKLQTNPRSEGTVLHVVVRDGGGRALRCGTYALGLDEAGKRAFFVGACDANGSATPLVLAHRSALFDHESDGPNAPSRPMMLGIVATRVESAATGGGAHVEAKSAVGCSAEVRPYMPDLERGTRFALRPDAYVLRAHGDDVRVTHDDSHWTVSKDGESSTIDYELVELRTGAVVLRDRVTLTCSGAAPDASAIGTTEVVPVIVGTPASTTAKSGALAGDSGDDKVDTIVPWEGYGWAVSARAGFAMLKAGTLLLDGPAGRVDGASLGLHDVAATAFGLSVAYERPWLFTSLAFDVGYASVATRSVFALSGSSVVAPSLKFGAVSAYAGPAVFLGAYDVTVAQGSHFEYASPLELGVGAAAGARIHLRHEGASTSTLGVEISAPVTGHQPLMVLLSFGWGAGH